MFGNCFSCTSETFSWKCFLIGDDVHIAETFLRKNVFDIGGDFGYTHFSGIFFLHDWWGHLGDIFGGNVFAETFLGDFV